MNTTTSTQLLNDELQRAHREGVTAPGNLPFLLTPESPRAAVLLVHGFTASPFEMRHFAESLRNAGFASLGVRLPGHGTTPEDLARRTWQEWQATVQSSLTLLKTEYEHVYGAGMSTGCLLLLALQVSNPLSGLVLFSPYLKIQHRLAVFAGVLKHFRPYHEVEMTAEAGRHYYSRRPVAGIAQINRLIRHLHPRLPQINCPVMAFNGLGDQTVDPRSGRDLVDRLGSPVRIHQMANDEVPHVLTGPDNPLCGQMFSMAIGFLQELQKNVRTTG